MTQDEDPPMGITEVADDAQARAERWNFKGNAYLAVKDYTTAISCFEMALKTFPGSDYEDIYLSNRATALFRLGDYAAAAEDFRRASELGPTRHLHFTCLGKVYLRLGGHAQEALEALNRSLEIEPASNNAVAVDLRERAVAALERARAKKQDALLRGIMQHGRHYRGKEGGGESESDVASGYDDCDDRDERDSILSSSTSTSTTSGWGIPPSLPPHLLMAGSIPVSASGPTITTVRRRGPSTPSRSRSVVGPITWDHVRCTYTQACPPGVAGPKISPASATEKVTKKLMREKSATNNLLDTGAPVGSVARVVAIVSAAEQAALDKAKEEEELLPAASDDGHSQKEYTTPPTGRAKSFSPSCNSVTSSGSSTASTSPPTIGASNPSTTTDSNAQELRPTTTDKSEHGRDEEAAALGWTIESFMSRWSVFGGPGNPRGKLSTSASSLAVSTLDEQKREAATGPPPPATSVALTTAPLGGDAATGSFAVAKPPTPDEAAESIVSGSKPVVDEPFSATAPVPGVAAAGEASQREKAPTAGDPPPPESTVPSLKARRLSADPPLKAPEDFEEDGGVAVAAKISEMLEAIVRAKNDLDRQYFSSEAEDGRLIDSDADESLNMSRHDTRTATTVDSPCSTAVPTAAASAPAGDGGESTVIGKEAMSSSGGGSTVDATPSAEPQPSNDGLDKGHPAAEEAPTGATAATAKRGTTTGECLLGNSRDSHPTALRVRRFVPPLVFNSSASVPIAAQSPVLSSTMSSTVSSDGRAAVYDRWSNLPSVALEAIAAGAAPVKWGREGAEERARRRLGERSRESSTCTWDTTAGTNEEVTGTASTGGGGSSHAGGYSESAVRYSEEDDEEHKDDEVGGVRGGIWTGVGAERSAGETPDGAVAAVARREGMSTAHGGHSGIPDVTMVDVYENAGEDNGHRKASPASYVRTTCKHEGTWQGEDLAMTSPTSRCDRAVLSMEPAPGGYNTGSSRSIHARSFSRGSSLSLFSSCRGGDAAVVREEGECLVRDGEPQVAFSRGNGGDEGAMSMFVDAEQWQQTRPKERGWRRSWRGRHRKVSIATCPESPQMKPKGTTSKAFSGGRSGRRGERSGESRDNDDTASALSAKESSLSGYSAVSYPEVGLNQRGSAPRQLLKQVSMPVDLDNHASAGVPGSVRSGGKTTGTLLRTVSTDDNGVHSRGEPPRMTRWAGGKSKRLVRDGAGSSNRSLRVPTEEAVTKWLIAVLGAGAAGGDDDGGGQVTLAGRLRDGVVLVRFVRAVGGARTSRIPKEVEATTAMMILLNVHTFMAAARRIGVSDADLCRPKDIVDAPPEGPCPRSVLRCFAALDDAVSKNASLDPETTRYKGPLLGDGEGDGVTPSLSPFRKNRNVHRGRVLAGQLVRSKSVVSARPEPSVVHSVKRRDSVCA